MHLHSIWQIKFRLLDNGCSLQEIDAELRLRHKGILDKVSLYSTVHGRRLQIDMQMRLKFRYSWVGSAVNGFQTGGRISVAAYLFQVEV